MGAALKFPEITPADDKQELAKELGGVLRDSRNSSELELSVVSNHINIPAGYLDALETGTWEALPGEVYARGYLKKYAEYLGFDPDVMVQRLTVQPITAQPIKTPLLHRHQTTIDPRPFMLWGGAILVGAALAALYVSARDEKPRQSYVKPLPASLSRYVADVSPVFYAYHCLNENDGIWPCYFGHYLKDEPQSVLY